MAIDAPALYDLTIRDAAALLSSGQITAVELTEAVLHRVLETEPVLHAYVTVVGDQALETAKRIDAQGATGGGLAGVPLSLKDLYDVAGIRTGAGSRSREQRVAETDSTVAARVRDAGAVLIGKSVTHEFGLGVTSPPARNPWDPARIPGGSSGGAAAAVAAGSSLGAFGTDTGCSARLPAALTGLVGFKPTFGRVGRGGVVPLSWSHDHVGTIARTVIDCALLLHAVAGVDPRDPATFAEPLPAISEHSWRDTTGMRIGVPRNFFFDDLDPDVDCAVRAGIETLISLGAQPVDVRVPDMELTLPVALLSSLIEGAAVHRTALPRRPLRAGDPHAAQGGNTASRHRVHPGSARADANQALDAHGVREQQAGRPRHADRSHHGPPRRTRALR